MYKDVECPNCGLEFDIEDYEGIEDWVEECANCGTELFITAEPRVDFKASLATKKECSVCGEEIYSHELINGIAPCPEALKGKRGYCRPCYDKAYFKEFIKNKEKEQ